MPTIARVNDLELRLTQEAAAIEAAQALRYRVFYEEMGALADDEARQSRRDQDRFDSIADHLVVIDLAGSTPRRPNVVGCYRLLRRAVARQHGGLYTAAEFDLSPLDNRPGELLELGRSCVDRDHRGGTVMQLLWRGIAEYLATYRIGLMVGCASLPGTDVEALTPALAYLHHRFLAPESLRPRALAARQAWTVATETPPAMLATGKAMLPPLLKAYLRMGGMIGEGAVVDDQFNTTDVCLVLPTERVESRYLRFASPVGTATARDAAVA